MQLFFFSYLALYTNTLYYIILTDNICKTASRAVIFDIVAVLRAKAKANKAVHVTKIT